MEQGQARALAKLFASKFISRSDVMAVQTSDGEYRPTRDPHTREILEGFSMQALLGHLGCERTLGHYMVNTENQVKLFALDIDLEQKGKLPKATFGGSANYIDWQPCNPREFWMSRTQGPGRDVLKFQMRMLAHKFARIIQDELEIQVAVAYSGSKGIHVYGFTGPTSASNARQGARIVLEACGLVPVRGQNFFGFTESSDPMESYGNFTVEIYPKQDNIDGKDLGNLMRLPLGVNLRSPKDRPFFIDLRSPMTQLVPMEPVEALTTTDPWR